MGCGHCADPGFEWVVKVVRVGAGRVRAARVVAMVADGTAMAGAGAGLSA